MANPQQKNTDKIAIFGWNDTDKKWEAVANDGGLSVIVENSLVTDAFDYIALTYVAAGDGAGEIETVVYKTGGSGGTTVATLTLAYNGDDKLSTVTKT